MAQSKTIAVTARKIVGPSGAILFDGGDTTSGTTKGITLSFQEASFQPVPARSGSTSTNDTLVITDQGYQVTFLQEYSDVNTAISASDLTNS